MNKDDLIHKMIKNTGRRAIREIAACLFIILVFGCYLPHLSGRGARFYGCVLIVIAAVFIAGITWTFTLNEKLLRLHPVADLTYWHKVFLAQARLLRLVPLWYLTPLATGLVLFTVPTSTQHLPSFFANLIVVAILFGALAWLNRSAAVRIEKEARVISS
jgi:hypothetical protein